MAMAVADFLASRPGIGLIPDDFPILATDISQAALAVAREGRYSTPEVNRGLAPELRARYFHHVRGGWVVNEALRRGIEFLRLNLVMPLPNLGTFDLILCRNFLIYLDESARRRRSPRIGPARPPSPGRAPAHRQRRRRGNPGAWRS